MTPENGGVSLATLPPGADIVNICVGMPDNLLFSYFELPFSKSPKADRVNRDEQPFFRNV